MCNGCCREFKGWLKSFTKTEVGLSILEGILLILLFVFLVFLIRHFLACKPDDISNDIYHTQTTRTTTHRPHTTTLKSTVVYKTPFYLTPSSQCTWKPSKKTKATAKYYLYNTTEFKQTINYSESDRSETVNRTNTKSELEYAKDEADTISIGTVSEETVTLNLNNEYGDEEDFEPDESDGEDAEDTYQQHVLALVKVKPPKDITFGCILTIITEYWVITAASCIEAIEEVDSLDSFVIIEDYGKLRKGRTHVITDVQIHPMFEGVNKSYDVAALKSEDSLMQRSGYAVDLPILIDYFMITLGESFTLLGYGPFRTIDSGAAGKRLHKVEVYTLPSRQCAGQEESMSLRHLLPGEAVSHAACGRAPLCAGVRFARGAACNYCAGAPLLRGSVLLGLMSDNQQCGISCEPQLYVNVAVIRDWIDYVTAK